MDQDYLRWFKVVQYGSRLFNMNENSSQWLKMVQYGSR